ncbi:MAG: sugar phosphate nucleotidyltransferase [Planctomycetaceae bacterium]|nr:sugar phosphate nucleotidyltransferase [Planctomycetaceae bacterium]
MLHVIILAGGSGTRLWPASRINKPKHLLAFEGRQTLLETTLHRAAGLAPPEQTWIITSQAQAKLVADSLAHSEIRHFAPQHIWAEPVARNTAASIGWAALKLRHIDPDAVMVVLPADHIIKPAATFCETVQSAAEIVEKSPEMLVTLGIKPTFPALVYGYIKRGEALKGTNSAYHVRQFCEKPMEELAKQFYESGEYYWNAGIFVWKAGTILDLIEQFEPEIGQSLRQIEPALGTAEEKSETDSAFQSMKSISIDYAVMERAENVAVLEASFDWNDVGTWTSLDRLYAEQSDSQGNLAIGSELLAINSTGCTVRCDDANHLLAIVGLDDIVVIQTADATLIARKEQEESVRRIAEELRKRNADRGDARWS